MSEEMENKMKEFFARQKRHDQKNLPSFEDIAGRKTSYHFLRWNFIYILKVAAILLIIVLPAYFLVYNKNIQRRKTGFTKVDQGLTNMQMPSDYLSSSTNSIWNWTPPTDVLLTDKYSSSDIQLKN